MIKRLLLTAACGFFVFAASAQTTPTTERPVNPSLSAKETSTGPARANQYNFQDKKILQVLKVQAFPEDFPKYDPAMTADQYETVCREWLLARPHLVKDEYLERLKNGKK